MLTSYHVHSTFSDGHDEIPNIIQAAIDMGLDEIGISDHYVCVALGDSENWSMPLDGLDDYFSALRKVDELYGDKIIVRYGIEADFDPQTVQKLREVIAPRPFDYIIGSIHFIDEFPIDRCAEDWDNIAQDERNEIIREYWIRIAQMARSGVYDIVGHMDLYRKFGYYPTIDLSSEIAAALDTIAESGMSVEINTTPLYRPDLPINEAYPAVDILRGCYKRSIPILINADAHYASNLTACFPEAQQMLSEIGYTQKAAYEKRKMRLVPLVQ